MYGLYYFILRGQKTLVFNRFFLVFALLFSLIIPFLSIPVNLGPDNKPAAVISIVNNYLPGPDSQETMDVAAQNPVINSKVQSGLNLTDVLLILYITGALVFLARFIINIISVLQQRRAAEKTSFNGTRIVLMQKPAPPFCFFKTIFISSVDLSNGTIDETLLNHELAHVKQLHSADVLLIEILQVFYWFNPVLFLYNRSMRINHEFLADESAIRQASDLKNYSEKLFSFINYRKNLGLVSGFNDSMTKRRVRMMTSQQGRIKHIMGIAAVLVLTFSVLVIISCKPANSDALGMQFIPAGSFVEDNYIKGNDTIKNATLTVDAFLMSNEITNREYREFTGWVKSNPDKELRVMIYRRRPVTDSKGHTNDTIISVMLPVKAAELLPDLIDSGCLGRVDKKFVNYFSTNKFNDYPVVGVSYTMATMYCVWKTQTENEKALAEGRSESFAYRLPFETEWAYASSQDGVSAHLKTALMKVNKGRPGELGVYHLADNVSEWVAPSGNNREGIVMGGSWNEGPDLYRRKLKDPEKGDAFTGFRIVQSYMQPAVTNPGKVKGKAPEVIKDTVSQRIKQESVNQAAASNILVLVDGKIYEGNINNIPVSDVYTINIKKYSSAYDKYGVKGKEKVIEITTKSHLSGGDK